MGKLDAISKQVKDTCLILGIVMILLGALEGGLSLAFWIRDSLRGGAEQNTDHRAHADTYATASWVRDYYKEFRDSHVIRWSPYVYWRRVPYRGRHINVDDDGIRLTSRTEQRPPAARAFLKIFMFGGSTMWGTGARDAFTIPSLLGEELQSQGVASEIVNYGESGYVSTQEVILLLLQLQKGHTPDLVIFYDGINDTYSAIQQRIAGLPQNEFNRVTEFNLSRPQSSGERKKMVLRDAARSLSTVRFLQHVLGDLFSGSKEGPAPGWSGAGLSASDSKALVRGVMETYRGNIKLVKTLGEQYRFKHLFYWQPTILQKAHLTEYERVQKKEMEYLRPFFQDAYASIRQSALAEQREYQFHDLSLAFADVQKPVYVDWAHVGETGNAIIARRMARDVVAAIAADRVSAEPATARGGGAGAVERGQ